MPTGEGSAEIRQEFAWVKLRKVSLWKLVLVVHGLVESLHIVTYCSTITSYYLLCTCSRTIYLYTKMFYLHHREFEQIDAAVCEQLCQECQYAVRVVNTLDPRMSFPSTIVFLISHL